MSDVSPEKKPQGRPKTSPLEKLIADSIPIPYVRFQTETAPAKNKEPVGELHIRQNDKPWNKYTVDELYLNISAQLVIWKAYGTTRSTHLANLQVNDF